MEIGDIIAISTAVVGILGTLITAIINYVNTRSNTQSELARIKLDEKRSISDTELTNINAATQMLNVGLQTSTFLQTVYSDCMMAKKQLEEENNALKLRLINLKVFILDRISRRDDIMHDFKEHIESQHAQPCEICEQLAQQLDDIMQQIEQEVNK